MKQMVKPRFFRYLAIWLTAVFLALMSTMPTSPTLAADGALDTTFGINGKLTTDIGPIHEAANAVVIEPTGKIIVAGHSDNGRGDNFALVRYNADGTLDTTFDTDGKLTTIIRTFNEEAESSEAFDIALDATGKIIVAGTVGTGSETDFALVRYNTDGTLDTSFDSDGKLTTDFSASRDAAFAMVLDTNGKIVVVGYSQRNANADFALARYNVDGTLDTTFDGDGKLTTAFGTSSDIANAVALDAAGKIIVAGYSYNGSNSDFALARYNTDGTLDTIFHGDGKLTTDFSIRSDAASAVVLGPTGKIIVTGYSANGSNLDFALARYNADGTLDTTFDDDGKLTTDFATTNDTAFAVALDAAGKIIVAGSTQNNSNFDFALARYNDDGTLDTTFDDDGKVITDFDTRDEEAIAMTLDAQGKIILAGYSDNGVNIDFALARYAGVSLTCEIAVIGNSITIESGDNIPSTSDHTDFGSVNVKSGTVVRTFTIQNRGNMALSVSTPTLSGAHDSDFSLSNAPASTLPAGASTTFQITFDPSADGVRTAVISIANNDSNENPYTFVIRGEGTPPPPATITIVLDTRPNLPTNLGFGGNLGNFFLDDPDGDDGDVYSNSRTFSVAPGVYTVRRNNSHSFFIAAITCAPDSTTVDLPNRRATLTVGEGDDAICTFTLDRSVLIKARVFNDLVRNGVNLSKRNAGDPWLNGWIMAVSTSPTVMVVSNVTQPTAVNNLYEARFHYLRPGSYIVCETLLEGWTNTTPGMLNLSFGQPCKNVTLAPGQAGVLLFGNYQAATALEVTSASDEVIVDEDLIYALPVDPAEEETSIDKENNGGTLARHLFLPLIRR